MSIPITHFFSEYAYEANGGTCNVQVYLKLIANEDVIFHRIWNVVNGELQRTTFRSPCKPSACPQDGTARLVLSLLKRRAL